tara:strand:+ start:1860 stop:2093 length:234 start_codon:yes stop_codon:yes gene_type:complete
MSDRRKYRINKTDRGWRLKADGDSKAIGYFEKKDNAVSRGRDVARNHGNSQLIVHKQEGNEIQTEWTYGDDPNPPKG